MVSNNPYLQQQQVNPQAVPMQNDMLKKAPLMVGVGVPSLVGMSALLDIYEKSNAKPFDNSFVGRLYNFGERVSNKFVSTRIGGKVNGVYQRFLAKTKNVINNNNALHALFHTPSVPECPMAFAPTPLNHITPKFIDLVSNSIKGAPDVAAALAEFDGLTEAEFEMIKKNPQSPANLKRIKEICQKVGSTKSYQKGGFFKKFLRRTISGQTIANELEILMKPRSFGKLLAKGPMAALIGLTMGGGLWLGLSAISMASAVSDAKDAPKGNKTATFMDRFFQIMSWIFTMGISLTLQNAVGGLRYIGKNAAEVKALRAEREAFNKLAKAGFASRADYDAARAALTAAEKAGKPLGKLDKIFKGIGKFVSAGRETVMPYFDKNAPKIKQLMQKIPYLRRFSSYLIGFGLYMTVFGKLTDKIFEKIIHGIFGKPIEKEEVQGPEAQQPVNPATTNDGNYSNGNLLDPYRNQTQQVFQQPNTAQPEQQVAPKRTYIPSPEGVQIIQPDTSKADAAIQRSYRAEQLAMNALSMK